MSFQSALYVLFLIVAWVVCALSRSAGVRTIVLLVASYLFYATWGVAPVFVLAASSLFNFAWGRLLRARPTRVVLAAGIAVNLALLASVRCADALSQSLGIGGSAAGLRLVTALGLSFYTFQAMSYLIDVYRGLDPSPTLLEFLLYLSFWPTLLSGPICRAHEMIPQYRSVPRLSWEDLGAGVSRIIGGLFMKMVLADTLARGLTTGEGVSFGFDRSSGGWSTLDVLFLAVGFGFQLFFDFAGYSSVAIGSARLFGIRVRENFDDPYLSTSPTVFWTRWHMSLSSWIRDYLFFPLSTLHPGLLWRNVSLVISMTAFGLWHGLSSTFLLWGLFHGFLLVAHRRIQSLRRRRPSLIPPPYVDGFVSWIFTFVPITLGWILFRAGSLQQAGAMLKALLAPTLHGALSMSMRPNFYIVVSVVVVGYFIYSAGVAGVRRLREDDLARRILWGLSPIYYAAAIFLIVAWSKQASTFVYFQF